MITLYSKDEMLHFIMTHSMLNSDYSPPLERKGNIYLIFEKGDRIIYDNENYLYLGKVFKDTKLPKDLNYFYKLNDMVFRHKAIINNFMKYYLSYQRRLREKLIENNKYASKETQNKIKEKGSNSAIKECKKKREIEIRKKGIDFLGGKCCKCGTIYNLTFVHRNKDEKIMSVSKMIKQEYPLEMIYQEILKCDLYCSRCRDELFKKFYT
jgi:hypothetical protein